MPLPFLAIPVVNWVAPMLVAAIVGIAGISIIDEGRSVDGEKDSDSSAIILPSPYQPSPGGTPEQGEGDTGNEDGTNVTLPPDTVDVTPTLWGFITITASAPIDDGYDPDIPEDIRPPSSSFDVMAQAEISYAGITIAIVVSALMTLFITSYITRPEVY